MGAMCMRWRQQYRVSYVACILAILCASHVSRAADSGPDILPPAKTPEELDARYQQVLAVLKDPPAPGALVVETGPDSPGRTAGIWPGDIITRYDARPITTDNDLRTAIADTAAQQEGQISAIDVRIPVKVRRKQETITLRVPKGPLALTIVSVEAGVPGPLNPPSSPRDKLRLEWNKVPHQIGTTEHPTWTALELHRQPWAVERSALSLGDSSAILTVTTSETDGGQSSCRIDFSASDHQTTPGFLLNSLRYRDVDSITAQRHGLLMRGTSSRAGQTTVINAPTTLTAVPTYAIATLAAALPQEPDLVLPIDELSEIDLQTRLGYVLATQGKQSLRVGSQETSAWCVQVLHFARAEMTFWFDDHRQLIHADLGMGLKANAATPEQIAKFKADRRPE
jgi:hypothetical protein